VKEGRTIYDNIKKALIFILPTNTAQALMIVFVLLLPWIFGVILPVTPVQILWVNMVTSVALSVAIVFEPAERNVMGRAPRPPKEPLMDGYFLVRIAYVGIIVAGFSYLFFRYYLGKPSDVYEGGVYPVEYARTAAVNMICFLQWFYLFNCRRLYDNMFRGFFESLLTNKVLWIVALILIFNQVLFTYTPPFQWMFETAPIYLTDWIWIALAGVLLVLIVEAEKAISAKVLSKQRAGRG
jgi:magnesium-transporting ATPase (P-type)